MKKALTFSLMCIYAALSVIDFILIKKFYDIRQYISLTIIIAEWALVSILVVICNVLIQKGDFDD
mgnify:CR=1 FL=1